MRAVSRFEANLLRILQCFLQRAPLENVLPLLVQRSPRPPCLSRDAIALVQNALANGCVALLARGGWRRERFLCGQQIAEGRLWERTPPRELGLTFSPLTLDFLVWVTAAQADDAKGSWQPPGNPATVGDLVLFYFAYAALRETAVARVLRAQAQFSKHGLCRLAFPEDFADNPGKAEPEWTAWTASPGACVVEALQPALARRWQEVENRKGQIADWRRMLALGRAQELVLDTFLTAVDGAGRRDLARFLLKAAAGLLQDNPSARWWTAALDVRGLRLADRQGTYRAGLVVLRSMERLRQWDRQARTVGYLDEDYAAGQLWKADWESLGGTALCDRAQAIIRQVEPLTG
jgi:hypothetical protein